MTLQDVQCVVPFVVLCSELRGAGDTAKDHARLGIVLVDRVVDKLLIFWRGAVVPTELVTGYLAIEPEYIVDVSSNGFSCKLNAARQLCYHPKLMEKTGHHGTRQTKTDDVLHFPSRPRGLGDEC